MDGGMMAPAQALDMDRPSAARRQRCCAGLRGKRTGRWEALLQMAVVCTQPDWEECKKVLHMGL
jgi:hypothetical protein